MPQLITLLVICGLKFPKATLIIAIMNCFARPLYIHMYNKGGPNKRILGAVSGAAPLYCLGLATTA